MRKHRGLWVAMAVLITATTLYFLYPDKGSQPLTHAEKVALRKQGRIPKKDRMDLAILHEFELTKDPATNTVPRERLIAAVEYAESLRAGMPQGRVAGAIPDMNWIERGPKNVSGRTRAIMVDPNDASGKTVWAAGVGGGLWKTTDITAASPIWTAANDLFDNIAVTAIAFNPLNKQEMYFGTGEGFSNADAIRGRGLWKTTDGGVTWSPVASTTSSSNFYYTQRIAVHPVTGYIYAATRSGLFRSMNGGTSWTKVLGSGTGASSNNISDIEIAADNSIYVGIGIFSTDGVYKSATGDVGSWTKLNTGANGFPTSGFQRIELACAPSNASVIYAVTQNTSYGVGGIYRSTDGGANWTTRTNPVDADGGIGADFTRGQAWYDLTMAVDPNNENAVFIGGVDLFKSTNGCSSWQQISHWYGGFGFQEVHADQHAIVFEPGNSNVIYFGNDGGIFRTANGTASIPALQFKGENFNVTQYYACAIHPDAFSNYFLAGAQDNGSQKYTSSGINSTVEVTGGDGCFTHIDQDQPQYQFTSYVYNYYFRSTNGGASFSAFTTNTSSGSFVNPTDYDHVNNNLYACNGNGTYYVILNAPIANTLTSVSVAAFNSGKVTHVSVSPNTSHRVFFGLNNGRIVRVDNANTTTPTAANIAVSGMPTGSVSCIAIEKGNDNHLLATWSNFGVNSVWETTNGGTTWTSVEGNLPDMPVRWALFNPGNASQAMLATEVGVWSTDLLNGAATVWGPSNNGLANTRTDMLKTRTSDKLVIAATHGRGLFSTDVFTDPYPDFSSDRRVIYTGKAIQFNDGSYKSNAWYWDFGDGTNSSMKNPVKIYNTPGLYTVTLQINGSGALQKIKTGFIHVLPNAGVPFAPADGGNFDLNPLHFASESIAGTPFEQGNSAVAGKNGTRSGSNAWVTGLTATTYASSTDARLWTPNFNFTIPGTYTLKFYRKNVFEISWDGFRIEYTLDRGDTWIPLGIVAANWYDFANTGGTTAFPVSEPFFNTTKSTFSLCQYDVSFLAGNASVGFRLRFRSDPSVNTAGSAIDDFEIIGPVNSPLPVELVSFTGRALEGSNELRWVTASELNNDRFEIERSENGSSFETIGSLKGKGTTSATSVYLFNDTQISERLYYYRLKQMDLDGTSHFSGVVLIRRMPEGTGSVFPNPFNDFMVITLKNRYKGLVRVKLYDLKGRLVLDAQRPSEGITVSLDFATTTIPQGSYLLQVITLSETGVYKIFKK